MTTLVFDTETNGLPRSFRSPPGPGDDWPRVVQMAWVVFNDDKEVVKEEMRVIKPEGWEIDKEIAKIHRITPERAQAEGVPIGAVLDLFLADAVMADTIVAHNVGFDRPVIQSEIMRQKKTFAGKPKFYCTMVKGTNICRLPGKFGFKWPTLAELHKHLFGEVFEEAHDALVDVKACARCYWKIIEAAL